ncbi:MAG: redox-regulated ATPase YchF [Simkaniaceae bacterium]
MSKTGLSVGIVGLPNVGKSTLFNALLKNKTAEASNYPFCTIDPNMGVVELKDERLYILSEKSKSKKVIPATVTFFDIAGLVEGASKGEGLGNKFLANIRETDLILHVVRCFDDPDVVHVKGAIDPIQDIEIINLELMLADLQMIENVLSKLKRQAKGSKDLIPSIDLLEKIQNHLNENKPVRTLDLTEEEKALISPYPLLTYKKVIYAANVGEDSLPDMDNTYVQAVRKFAKDEKSSVVTICSKFEEEVGQLSDEEAKEFLESVGVTQRGLDQLVRSSFDSLGLITFITTGVEETRAWTIVKNCPAYIAAGKIHTDIQKGFIRAEVIPFEEMITYGSRSLAKEAGKARSEGRDYAVKDGDVILFFHN